MIVTVNLAKGAIAMSRKKVIVKRLNAIQNFGAMDVLCTDKTGTLTQDKVILEQHVDIRGEESDRVLEYAYLNSYYQSGLKNLLDVAVLGARGSAHHAAAPTAPGARWTRSPFDFQRRRMSVVVERRRRPAPADLQGRRGGGVQHLCPDDARARRDRAQRGTPRRALRKPSATSTKTASASSPSPTRRRPANRPCVRGRGRARIDPGRLHRLPGSAQGKRRAGHRRARAATAWR